MGKSGINGKFWYLASLVILGALALGVGLVWNGYAKYRSDGVNLVNIRQLHGALIVMDRISAERGPANSAMTEDAGAEAFARALKGARGGVDDALTELAADIAASGVADAQAMLARLDLVRDRLLRARRRVDAVAQTLKSQRDPVALQGAIEAMFGVVDSSVALAEDIGSRTTAHDPAMAHTVIVASIVTELRDIAGRLGSQYIVPLQTQQVPSAERLKEIVRLRTRIEQMRDIVATSIRPLLDDSDVARGWSEVNGRYFDRAFQFLDGLHMGDPSAVPYPLTPAEFTARLVPDMNTLQGLRDVTLRTTFARAMAARDAAWRVLVISSGTTTLLILAIVSIIIGIQRFLFQPLLYIRDQIMAMALGTPMEVKMPSVGSEQVGEVLRALRLLRESQRARLAAERERDELNLRLKLLAETDPLTGLLNRRALKDALTHRHNHLAGFDGAIGVVLLDLDHFKQVNDVHGHLAGDLVLQETARRIRQCVRSADLAARYGGEEFAVIVAQPTTELVESIAERIRDAIAAGAFEAGPGLRLDVTASLGVALGDDRVHGWTHTFGCADQALYRAKDEGRNRVIFTRVTSGKRAAA